MVSALIEEIVTHYTAITEARTKLVDLLENALDGDTRFDFTWLYAQTWRIKEGNQYQHGLRLDTGDGCCVPALSVRRDVHPDYVFVISDRENGDHPEGFIAILRAANEEKGA